jgi:hypothetical protein
MDRKALHLTILVITIVVGGLGWGARTQNTALGGPAAGYASPPPQPTQPGPVVDIGFFYDRLAPYGDWRQHPQWGWVWSPRGVPVDWRPYTYGRWVYTDNYGWLWDSDEDWGWACFHYGRWGWDNDFGWYWMPGTYWGPAWVAWRSGPGVIGWCALPPPVRWRPGVGLEFNGFNLDLLPSWQWVFVDARYFDAPRLRDFILVPSRSVAFVRQTQPFVRVSFVNGRIVNFAFSVGFIEGFTHHAVRHFHVRHVENPSAMRLARERDGEISVFTPQVRRGPAGLVPPRHEQVERRQGTERAQLQEQQRAEQSRQKERHQAERAAPGVAREPLQQRQETERQALQGEHQRQQQALENRQRQERQESGRVARAPEQRGPTAGAPAAHGEAERHQAAERSQTQERQRTEQSHPEGGRVTRAPEQRGPAGGAPAARGEAEKRQAAERPQTQERQRAEQSRPEGGRVTGGPEQQGSATRQ